MDDDLLVSVGADLSDLERDLARATQVGRAFATGVGQAIAGIRIDAPPVDVAAFRASGVEAGQALASGISQEIRSASPAIAQLRADIASLSATASELRLGGANVQDVEALRQLVAETRAAAGATAGASAEFRALDNAFTTLNESANGSIAGLRSVESLLGGIAQGAERVASLPSIGQTLAVSPTGAEMTARAERTARQQANREIANQIQTLGLYGRTVDATSAQAIAAWRAEAAEIRTQAEALEISRSTMLRLDTTVQQVERSFARQQAAAAQGGLSFDSFVRSSGTFTAAGNRAAQAAISIGFALETVATGAGNADAGVRTALRAVASLAAAFGPEGLVVSGIAAGTAAIIDMVRQTGAAEAAVKKYAAELRGADVAAAGATASIRNLTAAQAAERQLALADDLRAATEQSAKLRTAISTALDPQDFGTRFRDIFRLPETQESTRQLRTALRDVRADFVAGRIPVDSLATSVANVGLQFPKLTEQAREFLVKFVDPLRAADGVIKGTANALGGLSAATHITGTPFASGLEQQITDARQLASAYSEGGQAARDGMAIAQRAFTEWRTSQHGAVSETLTLRDALKSSDATIRGQAEAFVRDGRTLAALTDQTRTLKQEMKDMETVLRAFQERADKNIQIRLTPGSETAIAAEGARLNRPVLFPLTLDTEQVRLGLRDVDDAMRALKESETGLDFAKVFGGRDTIRGAEEGLRQTSDAARTAIQFVRPLLEMIENPQTRAAAIEHLRDQLRTVEQVAPHIDQLSVTLRNVGAGVRGVLQIADAFGAVDDSVRRSVDGIASLVSSFADARTALADLRKTNAGAGIGDLLSSTAGITSLIGAVGGVASLVSGIAGLFAPNPEIIAIQQRNNQLLADLNLRLTGFTTSLGTMTGAIQALSGVDVAGIGRATAGISVVSGTDAGIKFFNDQMKATGFTFQQIAKLAKDNGIELLDSKGRLVAESFQQLVDILAAAREAALRWGNTLDDLTDQRSLFNQVHDIDLTSGGGLVTALQDSADIFKRIAPDLYAKIFANVDLSTTSGRATLNDRFNQIIDEELSAEFAQGKGWLAELLRQSGFTSLADFNKWLLSADGALDSFTKSAVAATDALGNVPAAFKAVIDQARFGATAPGLPAIAPPSVPPLGGGGVPTLGGIPLGAPAPITFQMAEGSIVIQAGDRPARELFDDWQQEAVRRSRANGGVNAPLSAAWAPA